MIYEEVIKRIEEIAPPQLAPDWDNSGIQIYTGKKEIEKILVCLEVTEDVLQEARTEGVDLIVSHHPLIFQPIKKIDPFGYSKGPQLAQDIAGQVTSKYLMELIKADISLYSAHLSFDLAPKGNNAYFASLLDLEKIHLPESEDAIGLIGELKKVLSLAEVKELLAKVLEIPLEDIRCVGAKEKNIRRVALCTGAGGELISSAIAEGCDLLITGDVRFHEAQLAAATGFGLMDAGHFGTEKIFEINFAKQLRDALSGKVVVIESGIYGDPFANR